MNVQRSVRKNVTETLQFRVLQLTVIGAKFRKWLYADIRTQKVFKVNKRKLQKFDYNTFTLLN